MSLLIKNLLILCISAILFSQNDEIHIMDITVEGREIWEIHLHSSTPKHKSLSNSVSTKMSFQEAKRECAELGFKKGTEKYGECVLELYK